MTYALQGVPSVGAENAKVMADLAGKVWPKTNSLACEVLEYQVHGPGFCVWVP